ncbi:rhodanese-like/PpiC domain-containing protein 12, chloroplastic isoform X2 [Nymphaea colorata]|uniref:rhodanese-like/PpiC domain-containing protein 12, chloroplastic isoform X2 n=1 Tax=Nymphaea colorata TaxID=210225 RepID=UPI00129EA6A7|nr:rhodanese-like/PpiC domain-containing protein 12, chloroplastic isoform X2 [Nymphaea colorata]
MARAAIFTACGAAPSVTSTIFGFRLQLTCPTCSYPKPANLSSVPQLCSSLESSPPTSTSFTLHKIKISSRMGGQRSKGTVAFSTGQNGGASKEILVQHLLVSEDNAKLLLEIQKKIAAGVDLSDLAVEYSICPSKENGGMLGWVSEFDQAAFSAPLNKVVKCKTKFGWHLLQVLSEREESLLGEITPEELYMKMQHPDFMEEAQLLDVREPEEVAVASLPGFKVLPLRQFGSWGPNISNEFDPEKDTYVLCHHGMRSFQVAQWLQTQGFKRVFNISGGIHAYAANADASIPIY